METMMTTSNNFPAEPEDIFADTDQSLTVTPPIEEAVETPIDSDSSSSYSPQVLTPTATLLPAEEINPVPSYNSPQSSRTRRIPPRLLVIIAIISGAILVLAGIVWGGYYWYTHRDITVVNANTNTVPININAIIPANINTPETNTNTIPVNTSTVQYADSDHDGLSDDEETEVNTNPLKKDTDEDGLSDREEVRVYLTDPRNEDTDADGYNDGEEVANFYHPNSPDPKKRLFDIPQQ